MTHLYSCFKHISDYYKSSWPRYRLITIAVLISLLAIPKAKSQTQTEENPAAAALPALYTSAISDASGTGNFCAGEKFTLTLTNVSGNPGKDKLAQSIGSVIVKIPAGISIADFTSIEVSDGWAINRADHPDEIRFHAKGNLLNGIPSLASRSVDNKLVISFALAATTAKKLVWETKVFKGVSWEVADKDIASDFTLVSFDKGNISKAARYPSITVNSLPQVTLLSSADENPVCAGEMVTFTAGVSNGVAISRYEFFVDGISRQSGSSAQYILALQNGQKVSVKATANTGCSASHTGLVTKVKSSPAAVFLQDKISFCSGESVYLPLSLSGQAPWFLTYKAGNTQQKLTIEAYEVKNGIYKLVQKPSGNIVYSLLSVSDQGGCSVGLASSIEAIAGIPTVILSQLQSQQVCEKDGVTFTVSARGSDLEYQWRKNGENISGATASSLIIPGASVQDHNASFDVVVSGLCGIATAAPALLTVNSLTAIVKQPLSLEICENLQVQLTVEAVGTKVKYQWYKGSVKEENIIKEATSPELTFSQVKLADAGEYVVLVTGVCGEVTSYPATLKVNPKPLFGEFVFSKDGNQPGLPVIEVNSALGIAIPLSGKELEHQYYSMVGYGKSVPLFPEYNFETRVLSTTHRFTADQAGVYLLTASATNNCGTSTKSYGYVVVANPKGGYITGNGTVNSPVNTQLLYMSGSGKATFAFNASYKPGTAQVTGQAEYTFEEGNMRFKSHTLDTMRLVIGGNTASFTGKGTINSAGNYGFLLSAIDVNENRGDKLRMVIWMIHADGSKGKIVYDSQADKYKADGDEVQAATVINNGNIAIHKSEAAPVNTVAYTPTPARAEIPEQVTAYPNPFEDKLDVDLSKLAAADVTLTVVDASGLVLYQKTFSASSIISRVEVDLSGVQAGMYFLQAKRGDELTTTKIYKF